MAKSSTVFVCQQCGESQPRWLGQCPQCQAWNTLVEQMAEVSSASARTRHRAQGSTNNIGFTPEMLVSFSQVEPLKGAKNRLSSGIGELDRVLGGGMVPGAVMLIGGEPGIGKSTLLTQVVLRMLASSQPVRTQHAPQSKAKNRSEQQICYVCGEENPSQISLRINRFLENEQKNSKSNFGKNSPNQIGDQIVFVVSTNVDRVIAAIEQMNPSLVIVDSIQTMGTDDLTGAEGSVGQLRESTQRLTECAKSLQVPMFLVGHVTKEGSIAGPKVLEHIVDSVLELTGERNGSLRMLRAVKNRFGATDEVGVFQTREFGLEEVPNPSQLFLEHTQQPIPGSGTVCVLEGTRPLLAEVQALVVSSPLAMPRRIGRGIELNRIQVLAAVLQKHCRLPLGTMDIFVSAAGGFSIREPAVDLGLAMAIVSSLKNKPLPAETVFVGEIGLLGEIRSVNYLDQRIKEARRLGFSQVISRKTHGRVRDILAELGLID